MLDDPLIFGLAVGHLLLSNLVTCPLLRYLAGRPVLSYTIITYLNTGLVLAYNLHTSLFSLLLLIRASLGAFSPAVAALCIYLFGFCSISLVGLHVALTCVRYLAVTWFSWIQPQDYRQLGRGIYVIVGLGSLALMTMIMPFRVAPTEVIGIESYLSGQPAQTVNRKLWPLAFGTVVLAAVLFFYLFLKWILKKRESARIHPLDGSPPPPSQYQISSLSGYIDVKSLVIGSFYALGCYGVARLLDWVPGIPSGVSLIMAVLFVNNVVQCYLVSRPGVWAYAWLKIRQDVVSWALVCQEWAQGTRLGSNSLSQARGSPRPESTNQQVVLFTVFPRPVSATIEIDCPFNTSCRVYMTVKKTGNPEQLKPGSLMLGIQENS